MSIVIDSTTRNVSELDGSLGTQSPYRALRAPVGAFARESHVDELAYRAGVDPVDFRLGHLDDDRLATVVEAAARRFGWRFPWCPPGGPALWARGWLRRGVGIAVGLDAGRRVATCAEVRPDGIGQLRVTRIVTAYEREAAVRPDVVLLDRPDLASASGGQAPLVTLGPAIANAIFAATGRRLSSLPPMPDGRTFRLAS